MNKKTCRACFSESFFVPRCGCSLGNRKKRSLGQRRLFLLNPRRNCPAAGLLAVRSCEKCHDSVVTRFAIRPRKGRVFAILRAGPYEEEEKKRKERKKGRRNRTRRSGGSDHNQDRRNCRDVVRALNEKRVRHPCWGLCLSRRAQRFLGRIVHHRQI